jgi:hypothetical protein
VFKHAQSEGARTAMSRRREHMGMTRTYLLLCTSWYIMLFYMRS